MIVRMPAFCLALHAGYRCRHAGACCRTWPVAAEPHVVEVVRAGNLRRAGVEGPLFLPAGDGTGWRAARDREGRCVFFDEARGRVCVIHESAGPAALPTACRHFPRVMRRDPRGTCISLSHFCPTAASLLLDSADVSVVEARPPLRIEEPIEGLDAREALPPLLRPDMLTDLEGYDAWERAALATFGREDVTWAQALDRIAVATEDVRRWRPGRGTLAGRVEAAFGSGAAAVRAPGPAFQEAASFQEAMLERTRAIGGRWIAEDLAPIEAFEARWAEVVAPAFEGFDRAMKNYLAARLFGNWIAYQGRGLRSVVEWLRTCAAAVRHYALKAGLTTGSRPALTDLIEAVRMSDLLLIHTLDTQAFARAVADVEDDGAQPFGDPGGRSPRFRGYNNLRQR